MFGLFKKWVKDSIKLQANELASLDIAIQKTIASVNEQVRSLNKQLDYIRQLDRKVDLLAKHFQLEYKGGVFISKRKK